jgi:hypothetical protein
MGDLADCLYHCLLTCRGVGAQDAEYLTAEQEQEQIGRITAHVVRLVLLTPTGSASSHLIGLRYFIKGDAEQEHGIDHNNVSCGCCIS